MTLVYEVRILRLATRELAKLDKPIARRIIDRVRWLAANLDELRLEALTGDLSRFCKLRVGDYRVLYQVLRDEQTIVIHQVGHRRDVYRLR